MARTIAHRELRNNSSAILREVQAGESFTITNHGDIVAMLTPTGPAEPRPRIRRATTRGGFSALESYRLDHPVQSTLDELRGDR